MRDPKRIDKFCDEFGSIWKDNVPDWRFGQLISNFEYWLKGKEIDMFFPEEKEMLRLFKEFLGVDEEKTDDDINNLHLVFKPSGGIDENGYEIWNDNTWYIPDIYLHGKLYSVAGIDRCGVIGEHNYKLITNLKNKAILKVEVIIGNKSYPAILYIWKRNAIKGLIVSDYDAGAINYAKSLWESESNIL